MKEKNYYWNVQQQKDDECETDNDYSLLAHEQDSVLLIVSHKQRHPTDVGTDYDCYNRYSRECDKNNKFNIEKPMTFNVTTTNANHMNNGNQDIDRCQSISTKIDSSSKKVNQTSDAEAPNCHKRIKRSIANGTDPLNNISQQSKQYNRLQPINKNQMCQTSLGKKDDQTCSIVLPASPAERSSPNTPIKPTSPPATTGNRQHKRSGSAALAAQNDINLSFCGCGFLGIYHVGVATCFHEYAPQLSMHKISGSSAGALVAVAHLCGNLQLAYATTDILRVAIEARTRSLGPFHPSFDIQYLVREALARGLPEDVHERANGKLHVSLTRVEDGANVIINQFESKEDVIQVLLCSSFIPFWSGLKFPKYKGVTYVDGGFSNNLLELDEKTVKVSTFAGEADICPQDVFLNLMQINVSNTSFSLSPDNLYRLSLALLPPSPEILSQLCEQGFADGMRYLQRMKLISCTKCIEFRTGLLVTSDEDEKEAYMPIPGASKAPEDSLEEILDHSTTHSFRLEQQEQIIEIQEGSSGVSATNQSFHRPQQQGLVQHGMHTKGDTLRRFYQSSISLESLVRESIQISSFEIDGFNCGDCDQIRQIALSLALPKQLSDIIREACDTVNKSLYNWLCSHRPIKYLFYLVTPYYLPLEVSLALIYKCWQSMPQIRSDLVDCIDKLVYYFTGILRRAPTCKSMSSLLMSSSSSLSLGTGEYEKSDTFFRSFEKETSQ